MNYLVMNEAGAYFGGYTQAGTRIWVKPYDKAINAVLILTDNDMVRETRRLDIDLATSEQGCKQYTLVEV